MVETTLLDEDIRVVFKNPFRKLKIPLYRPAHYSLVFAETRFSAC